VTKLCAENLCSLFHQLYGQKRGPDHEITGTVGLRQQEVQDESFSCIILRTSRFFPEDDDTATPETGAQISDENLKYNEYLHRRVHLHDVISAHLQAYHAAPSIGYGVYIISSTTPFTFSDRVHLSTAAGCPEAVEKYHPEYREIYERRGWKMSALDRVYVNERARRELGWVPEYDYGRMLREMEAIAEGDERPQGEN
jgi:UDP-glucose 4-epimerase